MNEYFSFDSLYSTPIYILIGGKDYEMILRYLSRVMQRLFGGTAEVFYKAMKGCTCIKIINDDIGEMEFEIYDETVYQESITVRLNRMCEEYDAFMRYKFRDSEEFKICNVT